MERENGDVCRRIDRNGKLTDEDKERLLKTAKYFASEYLKRLERLNPGVERRSGDDRRAGQDRRANPDGQPPEGQKDMRSGQDRRAFQ